MTAYFKIIVICFKIFSFNKCFDDFKYILNSILVDIKIYVNFKTCFLIEG